VEFTAEERSKQNAELKDLSLASFTPDVASCLTSTNRSISPSHAFRVGAVSGNRFILS
jgi:hypothetical protein